MKTRFLLTVLMIGMIMGTYAQKPTMTLTFTAENNGQHVPLNSILIENLTHGGDTTLYAPDTVLVLNYDVGIGDDETIGSNVFTVSQNYPNPIEGKTTVSFYLPVNEDVSITVNDIMGRKLIQQKYSLDRGSHFFTFFPGKESLYFLTVQADHQSRTVKMFNSSTQAFNSGICKLEYSGQQTNMNEYKSGNALNNLVFDLGDQLKYTASSTLGERTIIDTVKVSQTYTFKYGNGGMPCPGTPTITDIDGNVYNTVLIGTQCWMAENLKTTTYNNDTIMPNVTNGSEWQNLTTGAYVWYDNDISWKDKYGALYNWYAVVDTNGLCPTGWHVPTNDEWTALTYFIGGTGPGNELKSCRQVNSPQGGDCNTIEHPRWNESNENGTDDYGFSFLPGGDRPSSGMFLNLGNFGYCWSSSVDSGLQAWFQLLYSGSGQVEQSSINKLVGFSVRCLRD
jgi:uncharacterized protein (TIGR02145 family)